MTEKQVWVDEPPPPIPSGKRGKYDWDHIAASIKARPGEWLLIEKAATSNSSLVTAIRNRRMRALKDPAWRFTAQARKTEGAQTYAIYISAERIDPHGG